MASQRLRIMIVDHAAVEAARRGVYRALADAGECEIHLVVPPAWNEGGGVVTCEPEPHPRLHLHISRVVFVRKTHRVIYLRLPLLLRHIRPDFLYMDAEPENYAAFEAVALRAILAPAAALGLVSSRTIDHLAVGFPYRLSFTHRFCDRAVRHAPADVIFCRAKATLKFAAAYANTAHYLPHSVDCSVFTPIVRDDSQGPQTTTIGFVGRMVESKGIEVLLDAFAQLPYNVRLHLIGRGDYAHVAERRFAGIKDRVSVRPAVPYEEMPAVMQTLDMLVLPSLETKYWTEQFGRVLIEAMACGVPVIASNSGGIPDVVGNAGILFNTGDAGELAAHVKLLLENPSHRQQYVERGRARARAEFDVPVLAQRLGTAIQEAVKLRRRRVR